MNPRDTNRFARLGSRHDRCRAGAQGVALVTTLLLLILLTVLTLAMVLAASSDMFITGYYRNFRGAFYAADSGLNISRQDMVSRVLSAVPEHFSAGTPPIPAGTEATVRTAILSAYGSKTAVNTGSYAGKSWPGSFQITGATLSLVTSCSPAPCTPPPYTSVTTDGTGKITAYQYTYNYSLTSVGQALGGEEIRLTDKGSLFINATLKPASAVVTSFAAWGMFIDQYAVCSGSYLVPGTITGPVFTNGGWTFGSTGSYLFTDPVGSVSTVAGYQFWSGCIQSATYPVTSGGVTISPTFQSGFNLGQAAVLLPTNDYNQKRAVLDGRGTGSSIVTAAELNSALRDVNGNPYLAGTTSGVWLPYTVNATTGALTFTGGGIYVEGSAQVSLAASGASTEVWTINQGASTTTITIDNAAGTTTVFDGVTTKMIAGVPYQKDPGTGNNVRPATMLYVNGSITSLQGPGEGIPAIQDGAAITITAVNNITVTGDILYKTQPVTKTQNDPCCPGTPADTLIPGNDKAQVLGLFTATGDIQLVNAQASGNLEIDASLATISQGGMGGVINVGSHINVLNIVGGRIQNQIKNINATTRNVYFDRRFSSGGFAPPWFPSTTVTLAGKSSATLTTTVQRVKWMNCTAFDISAANCQ